MLVVIAVAIQSIRHKPRVITAPVTLAAGTPIATPPVAQATCTGSSGASISVSLSTATQAELETLPGVGPVMAQRIIAWRTAHGKFTDVRELREVEGVGEKTYRRLAPLTRP